MRVLLFNLVAYFTHSFIKGRLVQHFHETVRSYEINCHEEFERRLLDLFDLNTHFSDKAFPLRRQSNKAILRVLLKLDLVPFLSPRNLNDKLILVLIILLDLVKKVILLDICWILLEVEATIHSSSSSTIRISFLFLVSLARVTVNHIQTWVNIKILIAYY